jgi:hypothetical protein
MYFKLLYYVGVLSSLRLNLKRKQNNVKKGSEKSSLHVFKIGREGPRMSLDAVAKTKLTHDTGLI